jgi:perosamine synthetase
MTGIPFAKPLVGDAEQTAVGRVLASGMLAQGSEVASFERELAAWFDAPEAIALSSGTAALEIVLDALDIREGDEVIVPAFTFIATAATVARRGAAVVFADVDPLTYCLSADTVRAVASARTRLVVPVHLFGFPAPVDEIASAVPGATVLEDAAQAHGSRLPDRPVGSTGISTLSFYPTKNMTTGEGGAVLTSDPGLADRVRLLRNHGMRNQYEYEMLGTNQRMTDLAAAIGREQLRRLDGFLQRRREIADRYAATLAGVVVPVPPARGAHAWSCYTVRVAERDRVAGALSARGIGSKVFYPQALSDLEVFGAPGGCPTATELAADVLSLPIRPDLSDGEVDAIVAAVNAAADPAPVR